MWERQGVCVGLKKENLILAEKLPVSLATRYLHIARYALFGL